MTPAILSIQSEVVAGHVGHGAARFALQRLGFDVLALPTVLLSNHPGHGGCRGRTTPDAELTELAQGLAERGFLAPVRAVLTGYLGAPAQAEAAAALIARLRAADPASPVLVDPVFGDDGGAYAKPGVAEAIARHLLPLASIATPNRFELASLTSRRIESADDAAAAARLLGKPLIVATSVPFPESRIGAVAVARDGVWACHAPRRPHAPSGTGDLFAAVFLAWRLKGADVPDALARATSAADAMITAADAKGAREMPLIAEQEALVRPPHLTAVRL